MKIFLMYYDRFDSATTSKMLNSTHVVLCHNNKNLFSCIGESGTLLETKEPKGIQNNFNYALDMLEYGEWAIFMSDDLINAKRFVQNEQNPYGKFVECDLHYVIDQLVNATVLCDKMNVKLIGLATNENPTFAKGKKYGRYGLIDGRCFAIKKTDFRFHKLINTIPDYYATAYHLNKYKGNLILKHCLLNFGRYKKGGLGSVDDRLKDKIKDVQIMLNLFPENVAIKNKKNEPDGSHIIIKK